MIASFREADLKDIRSGTSVIIRLISDSGKIFEGRADSIGCGILPGDGDPALGDSPKVSRSINWVRVTQRFPVKVTVDRLDLEILRINVSAVTNLEPQ